MGLATGAGVQFRTWLTRALFGLLILTTALVSVGVTAPEDSPFSITVHPVLLRLDRAAIEQSRARAIGIDVDIKLGWMHVHFAWSALPLSNVTTNQAGESL
jgi:hypothetical protein